MSVPENTLFAMERELPPAFRYLARNQDGVVSRAQARQAGVTDGMIKFRVASGRWCQVHPGVYATFTGDLSRHAQLWAAVLFAGPGAALSHETAAEVHGLSDKESDPVHVTIPHERRVVLRKGIGIHRSRCAAQAAESWAYPPRTRVEETVLDLIQSAATFDDVCGWVTRAFARNLTDETRLGAAMKARTRLRWRADLHELVVASAGGDHSVLEFRYHRDVEDAHGLPESRRQVAFRAASGTRGRRDRVYDECTLVVELDGRLAHPIENQWQDKRRDNAAAADGQQTLRYGWADVTRQPCVTAGEVARVLRRRGWSGRPRPCSPGCPVRPL
jgi:hypothetical protein